MSFLTDALISPAYAVVKDGGDLTQPGNNQYSTLAPWQNDANQNIYNAASSYYFGSPSSPGITSMGGSSAAANPNGSTLSPGASTYDFNNIQNNPYTVSGNTQAIQTALGATGQFQKYFDTGYNDITNVSNASTLNGGYGAPGTFTPTDVNAPNVSTGSFDMNAAMQYMNPFVSLALDPAAQLIHKNSMQELLQEQGKAGMQGAFGGSRATLAEGDIQNAEGQSLANLYGTGFSNAFNSAGQLFTSDQSRKLQADTSNQNAAINTGEFNQTQGLNAYNANRNQYDTMQQLALQAALESGQLGTEKSNIASQNVSRAETAGQLQTLAANYPTTVMSTLSGLANPVTHSSLQNVQSPSTLSQLAGLATTAAAFAAA